MKNIKRSWLVSFVVILMAAPLSANAQEEASAKSSFEKGMDLFKAEKYAAAAEAFKQAVKLDPKNADAFLQLGNSYRQIEKFPEAIDSYLKRLRHISKSQSV